MKKDDFDKFATLLYEKNKYYYDDEIKKTIPNRFMIYDKEENIYKNKNYYDLLVLFEKNFPHLKHINLVSYYFFYKFRKAVIKKGRLYKQN